MDDYKAIYRILKALDADLGLDEPNPDAYDAERLGITKNRCDDLPWMMQGEGCVDGVKLPSSMSKLTLAAIQRGVRPQERYARPKKDRLLIKQHHQPR